MSLRYALQTPSRLHLVVDVMTGGKNVGRVGVVVAVTQSQR